MKREADLKIRFVGDGWLEGRIRWICRGLAERGREGVGVELLGGGREGVGFCRRRWLWS